ncbi:hypothetical protein BFV93_4843 [Alteromonas macleodii]|nr:hypothetical protein BFV93_4843 [Alteromonas macleodii]
MRAAWLRHQIMSFFEPTKFKVICFYGLLYGLPCAILNLS